MIRDRILDHHERHAEHQIGREVHVSHTFIGEVIQCYNEENMSLRADRSTNVKAKIDQIVSVYIQRLVKPSIYGYEIREKLLLDGVVHPTHLPSIFQINKVSQKQHNDKEGNVIPCESNVPNMTEAVDDFLSKIVSLDAKSYTFLINLV